VSAAILYYDIVGVLASVSFFHSSSKQQRLAAMPAPDKPAGREKLKWVYLCCTTYNWESSPF